MCDYDDCNKVYSRVNKKYILFNFKDFKFKNTC